MFFENLIVKCQKREDITEIIKEIKRIIVNYQIRDSWDIKLKGYVLWYNFDKLICKLN